MKWGQYLCLLKVINCLDKYDMSKILRVETWLYPEEFECVWEGFQRSPFHGMCLLDSGNLNFLMNGVLAKAQESITWGVYE